MDDYRVFLPNDAECPDCGWPCNREYGSLYCTNPHCEPKPAEVWAVYYNGETMLFESPSDAMEYALTDILSTYGAWEKLQEDLFSWDPRAPGCWRWSRLLPDNRYLRIELLDES